MAPSDFALLVCNVSGVAGGECLPAHGGRIVVLPTARLVVSDRGCTESCPKCCSAASMVAHLRNSSQRDAVIRPAPKRGVYQLDLLLDAGVHLLQIYVSHLHDKGRCACELRTRSDLWMPLLRAPVELQVTSA